MTRFSHITRHYSEAKVAKLRPRYQNTYVGNEMSLKLYDILRGHQKNGTNTRTFGILDPVQLIEAAPYLETVYVSGWTCSSTASVTHEPGPDDASYPNNTVPNKVLQFSKAQEFHDRKQNVDGGDVDYYRPIIADADTGFGGIPSVMKHVKLQIEAGAAGVHIEDQKMPGIKRCGHRARKVIVPTSTMVERLQAARLQADIMRHNLVIIGRCDAEAAEWISSDIDPLDKEYIVGMCGGKEMTWKDYKGLDDTMLEWVPIRSKYGDFKIHGGLDFCIARAKRYAPYCDMIWVETRRPNLEQARILSEGVKAEFPHAMLAYNCSPSFFWRGTITEDADLKNFISELGKLGFVWIFITLAGFHLGGLAGHLFAKAYARDGMLAYVKMIQEREIEVGCNLVKHQQWSGSNLSDEVLSVMGADEMMSGSERCTEHQFDHV
jgi:isocitrate lyase